MPDFDPACIFGTFGGATRLRLLAELVRHQAAGPSLDARIALETGWLQPYWELHRSGKLVTGVVSGDFLERYPLYSSRFKHAPRNWWDEGSAICNRVPNLPRYSSDVGVALTSIPGIGTDRHLRVTVEQDQQTWAVEIYNLRTDELLGRCAPGSDSLAKAFVLVGIDCRLRRLDQLRISLNHQQHSGHMADA